MSIMHFCVEWFLAIYSILYNVFSKILKNANMLIVSLDKICQNFSGKTFQTKFHFITLQNQAKFSKILTILLLDGTLDKLLIFVLF